MNKGDTVYYARIIANCDLYEIIELKIRTITDEWFVGSNKDTAQAYLFSNDKIDKCVFYNREDALLVVMAAEDKYRKDNKEYDE